jgi:hypothetical protein
LPTPSEELPVIDHADRVFHLEILRGGMNRLLFRSNRSGTWATRVEVFFMNVKYLAAATMLHGLVVERSGRLDECSDRVNWNLEPSPELWFFSVLSTSGDGIIVAGSVAVDESDASASDPSRFFMMD